ncbi:MAG: ketol-acid reductoisomerase [Nanoarchaeota archaeon]|nr:ketol-acid reductoisomerase [Nanoarchaeota archaeon]MBU1004430.1 ketol-acid reductoisomerase [Nanoarchaeota archaeon]MBU1946683.1 ketol-acid reductoisomerase [Nanoarchaeota archaeon]
MINILTDKDADESALNGKTIAVIGYGSQGNAQANCLKDSGVSVIIGETEVLGDKPNPSWEKAKADGFEVYEIDEAAKKADIIHILVPDEYQAGVYKKQIKKHMKAGKTLSFSHGFNICFKRIAPPAEIDVIMIAPKAPGSEERKQYLEGFGVPGLIAIKQNASGQARNVALALAKAMHWTRAGVLECTFEQETYEDLFGEQAVLCGGVTELVKAGFDTLVEAGYPPEMAYFECLHELKLIVDLMYKGGFTEMWKAVSNTAKYGGLTRGKKIITDKTRKVMKKMLKDVESGKFAKEWAKECKNGKPVLTKLQQEDFDHPIETVGKEIRALFNKK